MTAALIVFAIIWALGFIATLVLGVIITYDDATYSYGVPWKKWTPSVFIRSVVLCTICGIAWPFLLFNYAIVAIRHDNFTWIEDGLGDEYKNRFNKFVYGTTEAEYKEKLASQETA